MEQRKLLLSITVVGMFSSSALAVSPTGPPVATQAEIQYAHVLDNAMSEQTLEVSAPASGTGDPELVDVRSNVYYGCVGHGIFGTWSIGVAFPKGVIEYGP